MFNGKVVIITGGTSGIGLVTARMMAEKGAIVYACGRRKLTDENNVHFRYLDVTDDGSCKALFDDVVKNEEKIDILVCDAGITDDALTVKMTNDQFKNVIDVNLMGVFNIVKYVGPFMERQGRGSIVNISSVVAEQGNIGQANYAASKGAVISMTKSWAKEFTRKGASVRVNAVTPGFIKTSMLDSVPKEILETVEKRTLLKRLGHPEEIAKTIMFLASDDSSYITGTVISANGGLTL